MALTSIPQKNLQYVFPLIVFKWTFSYLPSVQVKDGKLCYMGNTTFFADKVPKGHAQSQVFASQGDHPIEIEITWESRDSIF